MGLLAAYGIGSHRANHFPLTEPIKWKERLSALKMPFVLTSLGVTLWTGIASLGLYTYIAKILSSRAIGELTDISIWFWGLGGMTGALLIGQIIDRHLTPEKATLILLTLMGTGFALVGYASSPFFVAGCFIWGLCGWASMAPQQHALVTYSPQHATALIAWNSSANYLGSGIGAALGGVALNFNLPASCLPTGALAAVAIALLLHLIKIRRVHINK